MTEQIVKRMTRFTLEKLVYWPNFRCRSIVEIILQETPTPVIANALGSICSDVFMAQEAQLPSNTTSESKWPYFSAVWLYLKIAKGECFLFSLNLSLLATGGHRA